jgi:alginate O-acetyltransferase complex protein AlgI
VNAYLPHDTLTLWLIAAILSATLAAGFGITRFASVGWSRAAAWLLVVAATAGVERLCAGQPAGFRMLAIIGTLLYGMKAVVAVESQAAGQPRLTLVQWLAFAAGWFGMRPVLFTELGGPRLSGAVRLIGMGVVRLLVGSALVVLAHLSWIWTSGTLPPLAACYLATLPGVIGLSLIVHFGIFNILAGAWRWAGVDCRPLFRAPLLATSLSEFWGRRWNLAFSEMTAIGIYRPLEGRVGRRAATAAAFLGSGLLHELAISVPVLAGVGLPLLYFALHGGLVLIEKRLERGGSPINRSPWVGWMWTLAWLVLPLPILFHPWFLAGIVWPLLGIAPLPPK